MKALDNESKELSTVKEQLAESKKELGESMATISELQEEVKALQPAKKAMEKIRTDILETEINRYVNRSERHETVHGGDIMSDYNIIRGKELKEEAPSKTKAWKTVFSHRYGVNYEKVHNILPHASPNVLGMLNIGYHVTRLRDWHPDRIGLNKNLIRWRILGDCRRIRTRWLAGADLQNIGEECQWVIAVYKRSRPLP
jgi:hypothetical protein